jgi:hypothetical protein
MLDRHNRWLAARTLNVGPTGHDADAEHVRRENLVRARGTSPKRQREAVVASCVYIMFLIE